MSLVLHNIHSFIHSNLSILLTFAHFTHPTSLHLTSPPPPHYTHFIPLYTLHAYTHYSTSSHTDSFFSRTGGLLPSLAKKLFTNDTHRPSLQVFPTVSMVRISVTDSGAGISKVRVCLHCLRCGRIVLCVVQCLVFQIVYLCIRLYNHRNYLPQMNTA